MSEIATFGAGCFWCVEAQFQSLKGVAKVESGYSGGETKDPTYKQVCKGDTGHAEVCNIYFDPSVVSFEKLLQAFWQCHDATQKDRQGDDVGTQYRSIIFYRDEKQKTIAEKYKTLLNESKLYKTPIVTEIEMFKVFYKAEDYHGNYFNENQEEAYCKFVIKPKLEKFKAIFEKETKQV